MLKYMNRYSPEKPAFKMDYTTSDDDFGEMFCSDLDMPMITTESLKPLFFKHLGRMGNTQWNAMEKNIVEEDTFRLLSCLYTEALGTVHDMILEVVLPEVCCLSADCSDDKPGHNYHTVTPEDVEASLGDSLLENLGEDSSVDKSEFSDGLLQLFACEVSLKVNHSLDVLRQPSTVLETEYFTSSESMKLMVSLIVRVLTNSLFGKNKRTAKPSTQGSDSESEAEASPEDSEYESEAEACPEDSEYESEAEACPEDSEYESEAEASPEHSEEMKKKKEEEYESEAEFNTEDSDIKTVIEVSNPVETNIETTPHCKSMVESSPEDSHYESEAEASPEDSEYESEAEFNTEDSDIKTVIEVSNPVETNIETTPERIIDFSDFDAVFEFITGDSHCKSMVESRPEDSHYESMVEFIPEDSHYESMVEFIPEDSGCKSMVEFTTEEPGITVKEFIPEEPMVEEVNSKEPNFVTMVEEFNPEEPGIQITAKEFIPEDSGCKSMVEFIPEDSGCKSMVEFTTEEPGIPVKEFIPEEPMVEEVNSKEPDFVTMVEEFNPEELDIETATPKSSRFVKKVTKFFRRKNKVAPACEADGDLNSEGVHPEKKKKHSAISRMLRGLARTLRKPFTCCAQEPSSP